MRRSLWFLIVLVLIGPVWAQEQPIAYTGAQIIPIVGEPIVNGVLLTHQGKITAVGDAQTAVPPGCRIVNLAGKIIMPGLVDTHSHIGGGWGGDSSEPIQPETRILDSINVRSPSFQKAQAGGLTTINVMPGSGHLCSGQTLYLKLRDGNTVNDLLIRDAAGGIAGGLKMANGTNSQKAPPFPGTRAKSASLVRSQFTEALEYRAKQQRAGDDSEKQPARNLRLEALLKVLGGNTIVHHHTHRHDDIMTVLRLAEEFDLRVVLHHISEGWKVAEQIAQADVPCSIILVDSPGGKIEAKDIRFETGAILERAGARVAFHTDDPITDSRLFFRSAALAVRAGMSRKMALEALTIAGAEMLDLQNRVGSLEVGKDADFIILDGDPLSVYTKVEQTFVEGIRVFNRADPQDRLFAVGGKGAGEDRVMHVHRLDH